MHVYLFIKYVARWYENSVRFEKSYGNWVPDGPDSVRFGMYIDISRDCNRKLNLPFHLQITRVSNVLRMK